MSRIFNKYLVIKPGSSWKEFRKEMNSSTNYRELFSDENNDLYTQFTPVDILLDYETHKYNHYTYNISTPLLLKHIRLTIIDKNEPTAKFIEQIKMRVLYLMPKDIISTFDIRITLFLSPFKKIIHKDSTILGINEINSGVTTIYTHSNIRTICIFRREEVLKVLCHELIHLYELDSKHSELKSLVKMFNVPKNHKLNPNEAYTEFLAVCYNNRISLIENNMYNNSLYETMMNEEIIFSIGQVAKILNHYGYNNINDILVRNSKLPIFNEHTSVFSYFIIKLFILYDYKTNINKSFLEIFRYPKKLFNNNELKKLVNNNIKNRIIVNKSLKMSYY
jgi:hypothetical protein